MARCCVQTGFLQAQAVAVKTLAESLAVKLNEELRSHSMY